MFLTRLGFGSKIVVTGDITQVDLPGGAASGLRTAMRDPRRHRRHPLRRTHQRRRRAAPAGRRDRRRLRQVRGARADESGCSGVPRAAVRGDRAPMSIEVSNESGLDVSEDELVSVARFVIGKMKVHPAAELSMVLLDTAAMADLHMRWMDLPGPDRCDELPDGRARARRSARRAGAGPGDARRHRAVPAVRRRAGRLRPGTRWARNWRC